MPYKFISAFWVQGQESRDGTVVSSFNRVGKIAGGKLLLAPVIGHALAADPLPGAGFVGTIAVFLIDRGLAFHSDKNL